MWGWLGSWAFGISVETGYGVRRDSVLGDFFSSGFFGGECPICSELGGGHFGHARFKFFVIFNFDGHLVMVQFFVVEE